MWQALQCRVRYFTAGAILGGERFVERVFQRNLLDETRRV